jgi:hypothetical protein
MPAGRRSSSHCRDWSPRSCPAQQRVEEPQSPHCIAQGCPRCNRG